jgi:hypothetical protein
LLRRGLSRRSQDERRRQREQDETRGQGLGSHAGESRESAGRRPSRFRARQVAPLSSVTLFVPWLLFPLLLVALSLGCGLFVEEVARTRVGPVLVLPLGLCAIVAVSSLTVSFASTARFTTPLVAAIAAAGFALARRVRLDGWALGAAAAVFVVYGAPVLLSGAATFAGYVKLDDTATFLALTDRMMEHGRSLAGLAPSSYEATLAINLAHGYPLGSLLPLGIGHELVRTDAAWLYQPWLSFCAATLALSLYAIASPLIRRRPARALVAFLAAQSALLFGFAMWGGVKELAAAAILATCAALVGTVRPSRAPRSLVPVAIAFAALLDTLSSGGAVWLVPLLVPLILIAPRARAAMTTATAAGVVLALPALLATGDFLRGDNRATFENGAELGNLMRPLRPLQLLGVWPSGDFRTDPSHRLVTGLLLAVAAAMVSVGVLAAVKRRAVSLQLGVASAVLGAVVFVGFGGPWFAAKALAIGSPLVLLSAFAGCASLASSRRALLAVGIAAGAALALGVASSNALAYHDVDLAPHAQLAELERIGETFAGQGPALMTEYQPYGVRHFLRKLDPEGVSELRRRPILLRDGRMAAKGQYVDLDQLQPSGLLVYRTLVLRRSPTESRPPTPYRLVWQGRWYEVWQREAGGAVLAHLSLEGHLEPSGLTSCGRPLDLSPSRAGTEELRVRVARAGTYRLWVGGSVRGTLTARVDGKEIGRVSAQLQNAGQWLDLGSATLAAGAHRLTLALGLPALRPGTGGGGFPLGPLLLQPESRSRPAPTNASAPCSRTLDGVEAVG